MDAGSLFKMFIVKNQIKLTGYVCVPKYINCYLL